MCDAVSAFCDHHHQSYSVCVRTASDVFVVCGACELHLGWYTRSEDGRLKVDWIGEADDAVAATVDVVVGRQRSADRRDASHTVDHRHTPLRRQRGDSRRLSHRWHCHRRRPTRLRPRGTHDTAKVAGSLFANILAQRWRQMSEEQMSAPGRRNVFFYFVPAVIN